MFFLFFRRRDKVMIIVNCISHCVAFAFAFDLSAMCMLISDMCLHDI